ncbi:SGNH/GDSL hydrolase family protein [Telluribacter sp.]|jgi:lysophospholipase L1-like esterase|uniref:SGNH/GDSL hydrolase family protein n=1 Tax=Telluribacter sp. TaxID=1978767 RepID=UPI002E143B00|nr:SGNH/GDSL hydrolase family protein [Telluribacter sp.]
MKILPLLVGLLLVCQACASDTDTMAPPDPTEEGARFLSLGDSYTIGESVPASDRWSVILADLLRKEGIPVKSPDIIARTGWTTAELSEAIRQANNTNTYDLVSLLIGVNNQYRGQSLERYRTEFRELLRTSVTFAGGRADRVFVLSIPDWGVTPFAATRNREQIAREIDAFNAVAKEETEKAGIRYVDITPISRTALNDPTLVASDGLHYSGKMHRLWAEKALPVVKEIISKN